MGRKLAKRPLLPYDWRVVHHCGRQAWLRRTALVAALVTVACTDQGPFLPPSQLAILTHPGNSAADGAITPALLVAIQDAQGQTVTSATRAVTVAIAINPTGAALSGTLSVNAVNGVATFTDLHITRVGTGYALGASSSGLTSARSGTFDVAPGAPTHLAFTGQPSNATAGAAITPAVQVAVRPRDERRRVLLGKQRERPAGRQLDRRADHARAGPRPVRRHVRPGGRRVLAYVRRDRERRRVLLGRQLQRAAGRQHNREPQRPDPGARESPVRRRHERRLPQLRRHDHRGRLLLGLQLLWPVRRQHDRRQVGAHGCRGGGAHPGHRQRGPVPPVRPRDRPDRRQELLGIKRGGRAGRRDDHTAHSADARGSLIPVLLPGMRLEL